MKELGGVKRKHNETRSLQCSQECALGKLFWFQRPLPLNFNLPTNFGSQIHKIHDNLRRTTEAQKNKQSILSQRKTKCVLIIFHRSMLGTKAKQGNQKLSIS